MNQTCEYLHLSNALVITILILVKLQVEEQFCTMSNPLLQCGDFDFELEILYSCMACMVVKILTPFLEIFNTFFVMKAHDMFVAMLGPC